MESLLIDIKNASEEKVLLAFLKSLKINYKKITPAQEDKALYNAISKGKTKGRASKKQQQNFEGWLKAS